jgi:hypothetical protein
MYHMLSSRERGGLPYQSIIIVLLEICLSHFSFLHIFIYLAKQHISLLKKHPSWQSQTVGWFRFELCSNSA